VCGNAGPGSDDSYADVRSDYQKNEVAVDYNAGFTGASTLVPSHSSASCQSVYATTHIPCADRS